MDEPVTDIKFVSSVDNCPKGYNIVTTCPCGHDAQLWEKIIGGQSGTRYICFTKDKQNDTVIEDLYIPSKSQQYLRRGYHIIKETEEGESPMYHRQLAVKSVPRSEAKKAIADIIVARSRDKISSIYTKTEKVNGLCICYRTMDYTYVLPPALAARRSTLTAGEKVQKRFEQTVNYKAGAADGGRDLGKRFEGMRVYETERPRAGSDVTSMSRQFKVNLASYAPSPPSSPGVVDGDPLPPYSETTTADPSTFKVNLRDYRPSPAFAEKQEKPGLHAEPVSTHFASGGPPSYSDATKPNAPPISGEMATASVTHTLGSAPPPASQPHNEAPPTQPVNPSYSSSSSTSPYPPLGPAATTAATTFNPNPISSYQPSPNTMQSYPPQQYQSYPPPPSRPSPAPAPSAAPGGLGYTPVQRGAYQPQPSRYPPTTSTETAPPPSYNTSIGFQVGVAMGGAPYPPPPQPGYQSVAGSGFGQSGFPSTGQSSAPYNPYHQQPAGGYPPPPPPGAGTAQHNQSTSYGFNF